MGNNKNDLKIPKIFTGGETTSSTEKKVPTILDTMKEYLTLHKTEFGFFLCLLVYIIIISIIYTKNPYDLITNNNGGIGIFLSLLGGFLIVLAMVFYKRKKQLFENEEKPGMLSFLGKIITSMFSIILIVGFVYLIFHISSSYSDFSKYFMFGINSLIFVGLLTIGLKYFGIIGGDPKEIKPSWIRLIINVFTYIPCLLLTFIEYVKEQYQLTTQPIVILLLGEIILITLYLILPWLIEKVLFHNSTQLLIEPENLNIEKNLGTFKDINFVDDKFQYHYALSSWIYLNSNPPETNPNYDEYTSLLNVGDRPNIEFNVLKNKLRIKMKTEGKNEKIIYETRDFKMQKWNNVLVNYDGSTLDIFINNELVSSTPEVIPYNDNTTIISGTNKGLYGGICNVKYFNDNINIGKINWIYNSVKTFNPPIDLDNF
tara:strand:- start:288 stop:1574 length:1287 start_codon:yes stop_codon:yes gene_type:complete